MNRTAGRLLLILLTFASASCTNAAPDRSSQTRTAVLLAVFAHADDEASVAPVLAKYAAAGVRVYLATATDGRLGVTAHAGIPAGDALATARTAELRCAAERLGLQPPILFGLHDQMRMSEGREAHAQQLLELRARVQRLFEELQPDSVITWPPSGWTGHVDHRIVSAVVTEVFQSRAWERPAQLFYPGVPSGRIPPSDPLAGASIDPRLLSVAIQVSPQDYDKAKQAWLCHRSQYTNAEIEQRHQLLMQLQNGTAHFQAVIAPTKRSTTLLPNAD